MTITQVLLCQCSLLDNKSLHVLFALVLHDFPHTFAKEVIIISQVQGCMVFVVLKPEGVKHTRDEGQNKCHASRVRVILLCIP